MKPQKEFRLFVTLIMLPAALLIQSCLADSDPIYDNSANGTLLGIGTLNIIQDRDYYFNMDDGSKLYPGDTLYIHNYPLIDGQRAFVTFTPLNEPKSGYQYNARILHIENILTKEIIPLTTATADSIGDDPINATSIWLTDGYLNINYTYYYSNDPQKKHMLNLIINETPEAEEEPEALLNLEFRHNAHGDAYSIPVPGIVSFRLKRIEEAMRKKKGFNIRFNSLEGGIKHITVPFDSPSKITLP